MSFRQPLMSFLVEACVIGIYERRFKDAEPYMTASSGIDSILSHGQPQG